MASNIRVVLEIDNKQYLANIRAADQATQKFATNTKSNLDKVNPAVNNLSQSLGRLSGLLAGISFTAAIGGALRFADGIQDVVEASDLSYSSIVGFAKSVEKAGGSFEGAQDAVLKFSQTIGEAVYSGSSSAQEALGKVGLSLKDLQNLSRQEQFDKVVQGLAKIENQAIRTKVQTEIFGKTLKGVTFPKVADNYDANAAAAAKNERANQAAAEAYDKLVETLGNLKQAIVNITEPLNSIASGINVSVGAFESLLKAVVAALGAYLIFGKALPAVKSIMDGLATTVKASGGAWALFKSQIAGIGSGLVSVVTGLGRATGIISGGTSAAFSFAAAIAGAARAFLRFAGVVGIIYSVVEAINFLSKLLFDFDAVDWVIGKFKQLKAAALDFFNIKPDLPDQTAAETKRLEDQAKALAAAKKAEEERAAAAAAFAERQAKLRAEIEKTGDAYEKNNYHKRLDLELAELLIGKTEEQVELFKAWDDNATTAEAAIQSLLDKKSEWSRGTKEQQESLYLIDEEIARVKELMEARRGEIETQLKSLNAARSADRLRVASIQQQIDLENLRAQALGYSLTELEKFNQASKTDEMRGKPEAEINALRQMAEERDKVTSALNAERTSRETNSRLMDIESNIMGRQFTELEKLEALKKANPEAFERKTYQETLALQQQAAAIDEAAKAFQALAFARDLQRQGEDFAAGIKDQLNLDRAIGESARRRIQVEIDGRNQLQTKLREIADRYGDEKKLSEELRQARQKEIDDATNGINNLIALKKKSVEEDQAVRDSFEFGWENAFAKYAEDANNAAKQAETYFETFTRGFEDAFVRFVQTGKFSFKDLINSIIADFARLQAKKFVTSIFGGGGGGGFFGDIFGSIGKIFGFANGGNPAMNKPILVGERGPELMIPRNASTIIPNEALGGGGNQTMVTYNIQAVDAASFQQLVAQDPKFLHAVVEKGRRSMPQGARR